MNLRLVCSDYDYIVDCELYKYCPLYCIQLQATNSKLLTPPPEDDVPGPWVNACAAISIFVCLAISILGNMEAAAPLHFSMNLCCELRLRCTL
jgi:hypothetical protein